MSFRFLGLPAELRNRIYEIAAAAGDEPLSISRLPLGEDGNYAGLTRACVQIRDEYRPIQRRKPKLSLSFADLDMFTRTFLTLAADKTILPLEVLVRVSGLTKPGWALTFDSLPILRVKVANPHLVIRIVPVDIPNGFWFMTSSHPQDAAALATMALTQAQDLNSLLLHSNKDWHASISNGSICEVYIEMEIGITRVEVFYMSKPIGFRDWPNTMRGFEEWRISHGLQAPAHHGHRVDVTFHHYDI